jgi:hypothetical protein
MQKVFIAQKIESNIYLSPVNETGAVIC